MESTPNHFLHESMLTMPKDSSRPPLPTSSTDFALPSSSSFEEGFASSSSSFSQQHRRRPSLHAPKAGYLLEATRSPLGTSFSFYPPSRLKGQYGSTPLEDAFQLRSESSQSSSSETNTPPDMEVEEPKARSRSTSRSRHLKTPPRRLSSASLDDRVAKRRLSFPVRLFHLLHYHLLMRMFSSNNPEYSIC